MPRYPASDQLLAEAVQESGLSDFGPGDFSDGLAILLESLERDGDLSPKADEGVLRDFRRRLVNRLEVEAWYSEHPEIEEVTIRGPVDINGLPRTGTTALADMLSLDSQFRCLRAWEQTQPCPPPTPETETTDPRRLQAINAREAEPEERRAMHIYEIDATVEDTELLGMAFHGQQMTLPVPGYRAWWRGVDLTPTYGYHRRVVKLLGSRTRPGLVVVQSTTPQVSSRSIDVGLSGYPLYHDPPGPSESSSVVCQFCLSYLAARRRRTRS